MNFIILGAKKVLFVNNAYAPEVHKPYELTDQEVKEIFMLM
jgi:hypothetical protein